MRVVMNEVEFLSKWGCLSVPKPWLQEEKKSKNSRNTVFVIREKSNKKNQHFMKKFLKGYKKMRKDRSFVQRLES
jgi:hypothetical protein